MQPLDVVCPHCRSTVEATEELLGTRQQCPGCGRSFLVTAQPPTTPGQAGAGDVTGNDADSSDAGESAGGQPSGTAVPDWWYRPPSGDEEGPVDQTELVRLLASGEIPASTYVWTDGMPAWSRAADVPSLTAAGALVPEVGDGDVHPEEPAPAPLLPAPAAPTPPAPDAQPTRSQDRHPTPTPAASTASGSAVGALRVLLSAVLTLAAGVVFTGFYLVGETFPMGVFLVVCLGLAAWRTQSAAPNQSWLIYRWARVAVLVVLALLVVPSWSPLRRGMLLRNHLERANWGLAQNRCPVRLRQPKVLGKTTAGLRVETSVVRDGQVVGKALSDDCGPGEMSLRFEYREPPESVKWLSIKGKRVSLSFE